MDADHRLKDDAQDARLRALFHAAGPLSAPEDLEQRVLARLSAAPVRVPVDSRPLLSWKAWMGALLALLGLWLWTALPSTTMMPSKALPEFALPKVDALLALLSTPWTWMTIATGALLLLLDTVLIRPRLAARSV